MKLLKVILELGGQKSNQSINLLLLRSSNLSFVSVSNLLNCLASVSVLQSSPIGNVFSLTAEKQLNVNGSNLLKDIVSPGVRFLEQ